MTTALAIVPARGGSKGVPGKNIRECAGKPLIEWTVQAINESQYIDRWILSTDSREIADSVTGYTIAAFCPEIADDAQIEDRLELCVNRLGGNQEPIIVLLQPTSPVRTGKQIDEAIQQLKKEKADSLLSVVPSHAFTWSSGVGGGRPLASYDFNHRLQRQGLAPYYEENGSIYVFTRKHWDKTHNRLGGKISLYIMPEESRIQIDSPLDFLLVEQILEQQLVAA